MKYCWDFFGPNADHTAQHFREHLLQFLDKSGIEGAVTGCESEAQSHAAAYCIVPEIHAEAVERALKPNRKLPAAADPG